MKRIFSLVVLILLLVFIVTNFLVDEKKSETHLITGNINVRVKRETANKIDIVPLEEYIVGVLAGEMPISFELEAFKAQAVAARSYVLKRILENSNKEYDVVDTVTHQVYLDDAYLRERWQDNYEKNINKLKRAVIDTKGEILVYNGQIVEALYFSTSNGYTEDSIAVFGFDLPYLRSVESSWDQTTSPVFSDQKVINLHEFYNKLELPYKDKITIKNIKKTDSGRITELKINDKLFKGVEVRQKLGVRSTDFKITQTKDLVYIDTKGYGHGVGMSQYGANGMAKEGYSYRQILTHYYQDAVIKKI